MGAPCYISGFVHCLINKLTAPPSQIFGGRPKRLPPLHGNIPEGAHDYSNACLCNLHPADSDNQLIYLSC